MYSGDFITPSRLNWADKRNLKNNIMEIHIRFYTNGSEKNDWAVHITPSIIVMNTIYSKGLSIRFKWIIWVLVFEITEKNIS